MPSRSAVLVMGPLGAWFVASVVGRDGSSFLASVAMSVISGTTGAASTTSLLRLHMTIDGWLAFWRISSVSCCLALSANGVPAVAALTTGTSAHTMTPL